MANAPSSSPPQQPQKELKFPTFMTGIWSTVVTIVVGIVLGLISVFILMAIHDAENTPKIFMVVGIIVAIIFILSIKQRPPAFGYSVLSIVLLMGAMAFGFILPYDMIFRIAAGGCALAAGLIKIFFY
jgi:hypothetical protein